MRGVIAAHAVRMGGALQHLRHLLPRLGALAPGHRWVVLTSGATAEALGGLPSNIEVRVQETHHLDPVRRLLVERTAIARAADALAADVLLSFNGVYAPGVACPQAIVAANALPLCTEYWRRRGREPLLARAEARLRAMLLRWSVRRAIRVITTSNWMARALAGQFAVAPERIRVVYHGVDDEFLQRGALRPTLASSEAGYVLAISKHGVNKDFDTLIEAVGTLRDQGRSGIRVRLTGRPSESSFSRQTARLIAARGLDKIVTFTGDVSGTALAALLNDAQVCVFPSWCESFGLPQVEAAAAGVPVIAPDIPVSKELLGDAVSYYRPGDATSLVAALETLFSDAGFRATMGAAGAERAREYTWERAAKLTLGALEETAAPSGALVS